MKLEIESGKRSVYWIKQHLLFEWTVKISQILSTCRMPRPPEDVMKTISPAVNIEVVVQTQIQQMQTSKSSENRREIVKEQDNNKVAIQSITITSQNNNKNSPINSTKSTTSQNVGVTNNRKDITENQLTVEDLEDSILKISTVIRKFIFFNLSDLV